MGRPLNQPLYVLPHGIEIIGEYAPHDGYPYWRLRIRPHPFFVNWQHSFGGQDVSRSRVVMSSMLGRALSTDEHVHHIDGNRENDAPENLQLMSAFDHNSEHHKGLRHTDETKRRISESLKQAYASGRLKAPTQLSFRGRKHSEQSKLAISNTRKALYRDGTLTSVPPSWLDKRHKDSAKAKMSAASKPRQRDKEGRFRPKNNA